MIQFIKFLHIIISQPQFITIFPYVIMPYGACVCACMCVHMYVCMHVCTHVYVCLCVCLCACMHAFMYLSVSVWYYNVGLYIIYS